MFQTSYFLAILPKYLRPQHSFSRTIKPNTYYRMVLYKGIQKLDQMKQPIKSKLISGKIDLSNGISQCILTCSIPYYTPNVQFTLKLFQSSLSSQQQQQISSYVILSSEYIQQYKTHNKTIFKLQVQMKTDLILGVDLIIERSKYLLNAKLKNMESNNKISINNNEQDKQKEKEESKSQTGSVIVNRQGNAYNSATKRLSRTRKNQGKILLRNNSISKQPNQDNQSIIIPFVNPLTPRSISQSSNLQSSLTPKSPIIKDNYQQKISPSRSSNFPKSSTLTNDLFANNNSSIISPTYSKLSKSKHEQNNNNMSNNSEVKKNLSKKIYMKQKQAELTQSITLGIESKEQIKVEYEEKSEKQSVMHIKNKEDGKKNQKNIISNTDKSTISSTNNNKKQYNRPIQYSQNIKQTQITPKNNNTYNQLQQKLYYIIFLVISIFLIYKAMSPTKRA